MCIFFFNTYLVNLTQISTPNSRKSYILSCSVVSDSVVPWTVAHQAPLPMGFSRQEYWGGCHFLLQYLAVLMLVSHVV